MSPSFELSLRGFEHSEGLDAVSSEKVAATVNVWYERLLCDSFLITMIIP